MHPPLVRSTLARGAILASLAGAAGHVHRALLVFGAVSVFAALSTSAEQVIIGRALQGLGAALVLPATLSIITNTFPRKERTKAIGVWTAVSVLGIGLGPVIGGLIVDEAGWSAVFWMHLPVIAIALAGMLFVLGSRDEREPGLDIPGAVLGTAGVTTLIPTRMRVAHVQFDETGFDPTGDDAPGLEPIPDGGFAADLVPELSVVPVRSDGR